MMMMTFAVFVGEITIEMYKYVPSQQQKKKN